MKELVYLNPNKEDDCKLSKLNPNWEKMLSKYMTTHYIAINSYEVHNSYFIAIDDVSDDTIEVFNRCNITIYSIDYIVDTIMVRFKDEESRNLVFDVLKV